MLMNCCLIELFHHGDSAPTGTDPRSGLRTHLRHRDGPDRVWFESSAAVGFGGFEARAEIAKATRGFTVLTKYVVWMLAATHGGVLPSRGGSKKTVFPPEWGIDEVEVCLQME